MNTLQTILVAACASGGAACFLFCVIYRFRNELWQLHERWLHMSPLSRTICAFVLTLAVLYAGTKPPSTTNEPPMRMTSVKTVTESGEAESFPLVPEATRSTDDVSLASMFSPVGRNMARGALSSQAEGIPLSRSSVSNWTARGAYCDWIRVEFPSSFAFPHGTNLLTGVALMAWGELRCNDGALAVGLRQSATTEASSLRIISLPHPVSLEPDASSFIHGLTPSNSYLFTWQNVCVNRSPTNRVDASIELFRNGASLVRFDTVETFHPAPLPPGFLGIGQDTNWLASVFAPTDYAAITNKGYSAWLDEDYVGVNEQNGHYRADITVASLPDNGVPSYLVCGPYNVVVNQPGTYSFPLEVFEHYRTRTYPVALPLAITTDDGYRGEPSLLNAMPMLLGAPRPPDNEYDICEEPRLVLSPTEIPLAQAVGAHVSIWCNVASAARRYSALISREFRLNFCNPSDAEIVAAEVEDLVEIIIDAPLGTCAGTITITDLHPCCGCGSCTGSDCTCACDCWRHQPSYDTPTNSPSGTP